MPQKAVQKVLRIWQEERVFPPVVLDELEDILSAFRALILIPRLAERVLAVVAEDVDKDKTDGGQKEKPALNNDSPQSR